MDAAAPGRLRHGSVIMTLTVVGLGLAIALELRIAAGPPASVQLVSAADSLVGMGQLGRPVLRERTQRGWPVQSLRQRRLSPGWGGWQRERPGCLCARPAARCHLARLRPLRDGRGRRWPFELGGALRRWFECRVPERGARPGNQRRGRAGKRVRAEPGHRTHPLDVSGASPRTWWPRTATQPAPCFSASWRSRPASRFRSPVTQPRSGCHSRHPKRQAIGSNPATRSPNCPGSRCRAPRAWAKVMN